MEHHVNRPTASTSQMYHTQNAIEPLQGHCSGLESMQTYVLWVLNPSLVQVVNDWTTSEQAEADWLQPYVFNIFV